MTVQTRAKTSNPSGMLNSRVEALQLQKIIIPTLRFLWLWTYGVVVSMFDFHHSDRGSNPGRGGKIS